MNSPDEATGKKLLTAVERLVASNHKLRAVGEQCRASAQARGAEDTPLEAAAAEVVRRYSNQAALLGGASALPGIIPGAGIALSVGATLAELTFLLKLEVEMALVLLDLYGFDIDDPKERQIGFLLASVSTYDAGSRRNFIVDIAKAEGVALWNYAPRRVARMTITALAFIAALRFWQGFIKLIPVVGIAVGTSMNKVLTGRVGSRVRKDLKTRRELVHQPPAQKSAPPRGRAPARSNASAKGAKRRARSTKP